MERIQDQEYLNKCFRNLQIELQNEKFMYSCISEGLIPEGLRSKVNLARDVNDVTFVSEVQTAVNVGNSRVLDVLYDQTKLKVKHWDSEVKNCLTFVSNMPVGRGGPLPPGWTLNIWNVRNARIEAKRFCCDELRRKSLTLIAKLRKLRREKRQNIQFQISRGSRKMSGESYIKQEDKSRGAPFPVNLRLHRRHRRKPNLNRNLHQGYEPTQEEIKLRNPVILTKKEGFTISEAGNQLCRMGPKTCPTPTQPVDELAQYESWLKWRESMRWSYHFNKDKRKEDVNQDFQKTPWYRKTDRTAPAACPALEAYFEAVGRDLSDPNLRRKISDNLTPEMREFIKEVKEDYPRQNLRFRTEDKGPRFVVTDGETEDNLIKNDLENPTFYRELDRDPGEEYSDRIKAWADRGLQSGEIDSDQQAFVTNTENILNARPKPQLKTHKVDDQGNMLDPVPIRNISVGTGTRVHSLSKLCQIGIQHLTSKEKLPRRDKSTNEVIERLIFINENKTPLCISDILVFADIRSMYPNVDLTSAIESVRKRHQENPGPLGMSTNFLVEGLKLCLKCNCVQFQDKFYIPCRGCAQGTCHACDFTDIWIGDITEKLVETNPEITENFSIYRDDSLNIIKEEQVAEYEEALDSLHPNLKFDVRTGKEGGHLDLYIMIKNGQIEWRNFVKAPPLYVHRQSCHDPTVIKNIHKGVGRRLRVNSSKDEYFKESVEEFSKAFTISGYDYQDSKRKLKHYEKEQPINLIRGVRQTNQYLPGCRVFYINPYDPRVPHPRKLLSKNYHLIANDPVLSQLYPRKNLVASSRRLPNLGEILSPTIQQPRGVQTGTGGERTNGTYHCELYKRIQRCDVCSHMMERSWVTSEYYQGQKFAIHGRNINLKATEPKPLRWFVYLEEDIPCKKQYVGSTISVTSRWANTKARCNAQDSDLAGLYKHFRDGCPNDDGREKRNIRISLIDFMDTTVEKLQIAKHKKGKCKCSECDKLRKIENKWILRLGTFNGESGLNDRNIISSGGIVQV